MAKEIILTRLCTARFIHLYWRTGRSSKTAEHTTISLFWF